MARMAKYLSLNDIKAYKIADELSDFVWNFVSDWDWFNKKTLGAQYIEAIDSISANIAEGFGRYHKKDKEKFYYNARGSLFEAQHWTNKAKSRKLITINEYNRIIEGLNMLPKEINWLIKITEVKLKK